MTAILNSTKIGILLICAILTLGTNAARAQNFDEDLTPDAGVDKFYFKEGEISDADYKQIETIRGEIQKINTKIGGAFVSRKDDAANYAKCVAEHKKREEKAGDYQIQLVPEIKKPQGNTASGSPTTKPAAPANNSPAPKPESAYYDQERCFFPGTSDNFKFAENAYTKMKCKVGDLEKTFTAGDISQMAQFYSNHPDKTVSSSCPEAIKKQITVDTKTKPADKEKAKKALGANLPYCQKAYRNFICAASITQKLIEQRSEQQKNLKKLENPELFKCETNAKNTICVQLTEKLGTTKVIGANTGLGLIKAYLALIYRFGAVMVGIVAVLMIIIQGLKISVGGADAIEDGKKKILASLTGLAILFLAGAILYIINPNFFTFA